MHYTFQCLSYQKDYLLADSDVGTLGNFLIIVELLYYYKRDIKSLDQS